MNVIKKTLPKLYHEKLSELIQAVYPTFFTDEFVQGKMMNADRINAIYLKQAKISRIAGEKYRESVMEFHTFMRQWFDKEKSETVYMFNKIIDMINKNMSPEDKKIMDEQQALHANITCKEDWQKLIGVTDNTKYNKLEYEAYCHNMSMKTLLNEFIAGKSITGGRQMGDAMFYRDSMLDSNLTTIEKYTGVLYDIQAVGNHVFRIEEQLHNELLLTDSTRIDDSFLRLPYDVITVDLPFNKTLMHKGKIIKHIHLVQWIEGNENTLELSFVAQDDMVYMCDYTFTGGDIMQQVIDHIDNIWECRLVKNENRDMMSYIISVLLYINSGSVDKVEARPFLKKPGRNETRYPVCVLGSTITINRSMHQAGGDDESSRQHNINIVKWSVRGHFRNQAKGVGRKDRELIWIRPFLKGREKDNEQINAKPTDYKVE